MTSGYISKLSLKDRFINLKVHKINDSTIETFRIVLVSFQIKNTLKKAWFFKETFLLADFSIEVVLEMPFLTLNNANIKCAWKKLT